MKSRILRAISAAILLICFGYLCFRLYGWWQHHQKRKALFVYLQKESPVTRRIPEDALAYANLYDFKRVYNGLQGTKLSDVLAHWMDTGMTGKQEANPLMGGMIEKTVLNVVGEEFGFCLLPSDSRRMDFLAVARVAPGSEFLLKLALASSKNARKTPFGEETIYSFDTKNPEYPEVFVFLNEDFAFAASDLDRIKKAIQNESGGPLFLRKKSIEAIPEDTFLFVQCAQPQLFALASGTSPVFRIIVSGDAKIPSRLPELIQERQDILMVQTNGSEIFQLPSASYSLESVDGDSLSTVLLSFGDRKNAKRYFDKIVESLSADYPPELIEQRSESSLNCLRYRLNDEDMHACIRNATILLARGKLSLLEAGIKWKETKKRDLPFTLRVKFQNEPLQEFISLVEKKDWNRFLRAKEFYFLSCIRYIQGSVDGSENEISAEIY